VNLLGLAGLIEHAPDQSELCSWRVSCGVDVGKAEFAGFETLGSTLKWSQFAFCSNMSCRVSLIPAMSFSSPLLHLSSSVDIKTLVVGSGVKIAQSGGTVVWVA
jgi:hypothetical protein